MYYQNYDDYNYDNTLCNYFLNVIIYLNSSKYNFSIFDTISSKENNIKEETNQSNDEQYKKSSRNR